MWCAVDWFVKGDDFKRNVSQTKNIFSNLEVSNPTHFIQCAALDKFYRQSDHMQYSFADIHLTGIRPSWRRK